MSKTPLPKLSPIPEKNLRFKAFLWLVKRDKRGELIRAFFRHPFSYSFRYLFSLLKKSPFKKEGPFFYYGLSGEEAFKELLIQPATTLFVVFSYCQKPLECPAKRFSERCIQDFSHPTCCTCSIGKLIQAMPKKSLYLIVPTVHDMARGLFKLLKTVPKEKICFLTMACELSLQMFADWGHMAGVRGIGYPLAGRTCLTFRSFALAEEGFKRGQTEIESEAEQKILSFFHLKRSTLKKE